MLAQFVVQGLARNAQGLGQAAHGAVGLGQFGGDQRAFELLDLLAEVAAAQGVLEGAGGAVLNLDGQVFSYPPRESLLNPFFLALPAAAPWRERLLQLASTM